MKERNQAWLTPVGGSVEIEVQRSYDAFSLSPDAEPVRRATRAAEQIGATARITSTGGGSDANIFNANNIPMAVLGVGYEEIHSTRERMPVNQLVQLSEWVLALVQG